MDHIETAPIMAPGKIMVRFCADDVKRALLDYAIAKGAPIPESAKADVESVSLYGIDRKRQDRAKLIIEMDTTDG